ncbi:MAG: ATP-binding domain-containing protein [Deltaproteobacteria bacterium]|nr:ATP-binding domain-containing protein [Deltaproteobacteria bacterium]
MVDEVLEHARLQFDEPTESRMHGFDPDRLTAVDGRSLDEGTPEEIAGTIDVEDFAVLLELVRLKTGKIKTPHGRMHTYAHMVVDEAQDLAPVELRVLGESLRSTASVTIAGDAAQQIDPSASFKSWEDALDLLGVKRVSSAHLKTTYRSPRPIAEYAHRVLGPIAPAEAPVAVRDGVPVAQSLFPNEGHAAVFLTEALAALFRREPRASVAVIARRPRVARRVFASLSRLPNTRLVLDGEFSFQPGVDVTCVAQVKGLEFDYVVLPDAEPGSYPDTPESRRMLHVAATRAIHQLWVISLGKPSPILPA